MPDRDALRYDAAGLIPVVAQDTGTKDVLMVAYMNREALARTLATRQAWYWSRSRRRLWRKGEESGHTQRVRDVRVDCDGDTLLLLVDQTGPACHTGNPTCFYRDVDRSGTPIGPGGPTGPGEPGPTAWASTSAAPADPEESEPAAAGPAASGGGAAGPEILTELAAVLASRRQDPRPGSYSASLFAEGLTRLNEKVMEEASEVARAARRETPERLVSEVADLWFHSLALLVHQGIDPAGVYAELARRRR